MCIALCASSADSQTFTTLLQFSGTGGAAGGDNQFGYGSLTISGTTLYGMTSGGVLNPGNIFSVGTDGTNYKNLLSFTANAGTASGADPTGSLTLCGTSLYGTTATGGTNSYYGNVFSVGTSGTSYQNLLSFTGTGGAASGNNPFGKLAISDTTVYGMTQSGGTNADGNIFSMGTDGTNYRNLLSFTGSGGPASGALPQGSLTLNGTAFYGMTANGGAQGDGNIFSVGTEGTNYHNLLSFTGTGGAASGAYPGGSLAFAGTTLYGMTNKGGANGDGNIFSVGIDGTSYKNLLSFTGTGGAALGEFPLGSVTLSGTTIYGMTAYGGADGWGNIFSVGIDGSDYQDLYDFTGGTDGGLPYGDLTLSGGTLFGMTAEGGVISGPFSYGTVFALVLPTPTPEPGTLALVGAGTVALVSYRWRRMRPRRENRR